MQQHISSLNLSGEAAHRREITNASLTQARILIFLDHGIHLVNNTEH